MDMQICTEDEDCQVMVNIYEHERLFSHYVSVKDN